MRYIGDIKGEVNLIEKMILIVEAEHRLLVFRQKY